ncbi:MAG: 1-acyl-sn-glycerol-3-phosphate acyltransferase [Verrucomicrobiota bacterium]|jgi:1-acyl-sn-glycerol-3-phosphate acyltransferase
MNWSYRLGWIVFRAVFGVFFRARYHHTGRVPRQGPVILAANHASFIDPPLIGASLPRMVNFLARDTLFAAPVVGPLLRSWRVVPVDREGGGGAGLKAILDRLLGGGVILLFPEGTRTPDGRLRPARSGIGLTVIKSQAPVVPVLVRGTYAAYGRHLRIPRPRPVSVVFGEPLAFAALREEARHCDKPRLKAIYQQVADEIMAAIAALEREAGARAD